MNHVFISNLFKTIYGTEEIKEKTKISFTISMQEYQNQPNNKILHNNFTGCNPIITLVHEESLQRYCVRII